MDLEFLDRLEDKVDLCVARVRDLRARNDDLEAATGELEARLAKLTRDAEGGAGARAEAEELRAHCAVLERKLERVRNRIEAVVKRIHELEE